MESSFYRKRQRISSHLCRRCICHVCTALLSFKTNSDASYIAVWPIFVGAAIIALFLFLLNMTQPASEEQLKSAFLLVQIGILFLMIWCQILDLFVFFDTGAREITKGFHFRIFLWDITSFALFIFALFPLVWQLCQLDVRLSASWRILFLQLLWMRIVFFTFASTKIFNR